MLPADLARLHKYLLEIEHSDHISDEIRSAEPDRLWRVPSSAEGGLQPCLELSFYLRCWC